MRFPVLSSILCFAFPLLSQALPDDRLQVRLRQAATANNLDAPGSPPFHLKLAVALDARPDAFPPRSAEQGAIELWWSAPDQQRIAYDFPSYKAVVLLSGADAYRTPGTEAVPYLLHYTLEHFLHPVLAQDAAIAALRLKASQRTLKSGSLDCIDIALPPTKPGEPLPTFARNVPEQYCFDPGSPILRITYDLAGQDTIRNRLGNFRSIHVPIDLQYSFSGKPYVEAHLDQLQGQAAPYAATLSHDGLDLIPGPPKPMPGALVAGSILKKDNPLYPQLAKMNHVQGSVLLHAIIGADGRISKLDVIGSPDRSLSESALFAVRNWTYKPYLLNGVPTSVETEITVDYAISR